MPFSVVTHSFLSQPLWHLMSVQRRAAENLRINHQYQVNEVSLKAC